MARRTNRQVLVDRVEAAVSLMKQAEDRLAIAVSIYHEQGAYQGAQLELIREGLAMISQTTERFRYEIM